MNILDRYIAKIIIEATLLALLVLIGMQSFMLFVGELHDIGIKNYGLLQALIYVPMQLPSNVYVFFPIAGIIGCIMGLGRLAVHSELIVMRAAGVSIAKITISVIKAAVLMLIIVTFIGEWWAPYLQHHADVRKTMAMSGGQTLNTMQGTWVRDGNNFIYINQVLPNGELQNVTRYQFANNHQLILASSAQTGTYQDGRWIFQNIEQSTLKKNQVTSQHFDQQKWDVTFNPRLLRMTTLDPSQLSLPRLYHYIQYLKQTNQAASKTEFAFWQRVFQPLATLIMICLGVPFIFGPLRSVTMGLRILTGIVVGFGFYTLNQFFGPLSMVAQLPPLLAAALPAILFALGGGVLLWTSR